MQDLTVVSFREAVNPNFDFPVLVDDSNSLKTWCRAITTCPVMLVTSWPCLICEGKGHVCYVYCCVPSIRPSAEVGQ